MRLRVLRFAAFVTLTALLTVWIGSNISGVAGGSRYELTATFDDVAGMHSGDEVKVAGLTVGEVLSIEADKGRAEVRFSIDDTVPLPSDSSVAVRWRNLVGQRYLGVTPGVSGTLLDDGDEMAQTADVVDLGQLVNKLVPLAQAVSPDQINEILTTLVEAFEGNDDSFDALIADLDRVLGSLAQRDTTIDQLLQDYDTVAGAVASRDAQVGQMVDNLVAISETFAENDDLLDAALVELAALSTDLDSLLDQSAGDLGLSLDHLATLTSTAAANVGVLESGLQGLPLMFDTLLAAVGQGEWLRVSALCIVVDPGPCPTPIVVSDDDRPFVIDPGGVLGGLLEGLDLGPGGGS